MNRLLFIAINCLIVVSCDEFLCGSLDKGSQELINNASEKYNESVKIENIACEYHYLNIYLRSNKLDLDTVSLIHNELYNSKSQKGWRSIHVFDKNDVFLYIHHYTGKISYKGNAKDALE